MLLAKATGRTRTAISGVCALALFTACLRAPDETQIRNAIDTMVTALEAHDNRSFLDYIAEGYRDHEGRDRQGLRQLLLAHFVRHRNIKLLVSGITVEVHGKRAEVRLQAQLTSGEQLMADRQFGAYRVRTLWRRQSGSWMVYQAEWVPLSEWSGS